MSARGPTLPDAVQVDSFWRSRRHEAVVSTLSTFEGRIIFDVRIHEMQQGVAVVVLRLPDLAKAITKALRKAQELGLLPDDGGEA